MAEPREVPSGKFYRQLFDAQVQLSRRLRAARRDGGLTAASSAASRGQQTAGPPRDDHVDDVMRLPDCVGLGGASSNIIQRLQEKKLLKHRGGVEQLEAELTGLTQVYESQVRSVSLQLLSSLQDLDLRLYQLRVRMDHFEDVSLQDLYNLWQQVDQEVMKKKMRIAEFKLQLSECETQRTQQIRTVLRKYCCLLETISLLPITDIHRLMHNEATMLNQSLLGNRRCVAHLLLLLEEDNLRQTCHLRQHWEDGVRRWRGRNVRQVLDWFRSILGDHDDHLALEQQVLHVVTQNQSRLIDRRGDIISQISSLAPPFCTTDLVSDWFKQLTDVNQQIDSFHSALLLQLRAGYEQVWQDRLSEVKLCQEMLLALQLSGGEVSDIVGAELLTVITERQNEDEERLASLERWAESLSGTAARFSGCISEVMRASATLWETHCHNFQSREEEVQRQLDDLRSSREQHVQKKKAVLDKLIGGLRQESSEEALRTSLEATVRYLMDVQLSCEQFVSDQCAAVDLLPSLHIHELIIYSRHLSTFFCLDHTFTPSPEDLQRFQPLPSKTSDTVTSHTEGSLSVEEDPEPGPVREEDEDPSAADDWMSEAQSALLQLYDISTPDTFASSGGVAYTGPTFRCPAPVSDDDLQETWLIGLPVELLSHTLSRTRTLYLDHLEQRFHNVLTSSATMVMERKEEVRSNQELQLLQLDPEHIKTHIYQPRLAELCFHRQCVDSHCQDVSSMLTSCRAELQELKASVSRKNQELIEVLTNMEDTVRTADRRSRIEALSSALQDCLDHHIKNTQHRQASFRCNVQVRLEELRVQTSRLLDSFRLFSEGGDCAPSEVRSFQRRLKEETKQIQVTEESIFTELEAFECRSFKQVKEASGHLEEKLSLLQAEAKFLEKVQRIISRSQVQIKAQVAGSNHQQTSINRRLEELRTMMADGQASADRVFLFLSSVSQELRRRHRYLDSSCRTSGPKSRRPSNQAPAGFLQPSRSGMNILDDPVVGVVQSLSRLGQVQDAAVEREQRTVAGQSPIQRFQQRCSLSAGALRFIRSDRRFQVFGSKPETNRKSDSFISTVTSVLWTANEELLLVAEDFYQTERRGGFNLLPDCLDQCAENMQQRLLGYQEEATALLSTSREALVQQQCELAEMLCSLPGVLISNLERQQGEELRREAAAVRDALDEKLAAGEEQKRRNVARLKASLSDGELRTLSRGEELRQQELHDAICRCHRDLQECVQRRGEEFTAALASLTEKLFQQLDHLSAVQKDPADITAVAMETRLVTNRSRTWPGIPHLMPPSDEAADSMVTMVTTPSITTAMCTPGHLVVIEQRDATVKRFEQVVRSEISHSDAERQRQLSNVQSWRSHWRQQTHTLIHTDNRHTH